MKTFLCTIILLVRYKKHFLVYNVSSYNYLTQGRNLDCSLQVFSNSEKLYKEPTKK